MMRMMNTSRRGVKMSILRMRLIPKVQVRNSEMSADVDISKTYRSKAKASIKPRIQRKFINITSC